MLLLIKMNNTAELYVSRRAPLSCYDMAIFLSKAGVITNVTTNITTQPAMEYGCKIIQPITSKKDVETTWALLKNEYNLQCAYLKIDSLFSGCILDYLQPSLCGKNIEN